MRDVEPKNGNGKRPGQWNHRSKRKRQRTNSSWSKFIVKLISQHVTSVFVFFLGTNSEAIPVEIKIPLTGSVASDDLMSFGVCFSQYFDKWAFFICIWNHNH